MLCILFFFFFFFNDPPPTEIYPLPLPDALPICFAAAFLNTLVQELMDSNMEARSKSSEYTSQWLSRQLEDMRIKLEHSENALQSYARSTGLIFTSEKTKISEEKLQQLQGELSKTQTDRITA